MLETYSLFVPLWMQLIHISVFIEPNPKCKGLYNQPCQIDFHSIKPSSPGILIFSLSFKHTWTLNCFLLYIFIYSVNPLNLHPNPEYLILSMLKILISFNASSNSSLTPSLDFWSEDLPNCNCTKPTFNLYNNIPLFVLWGILSPPWDMHCFYDIKNPMV